MKSFNLNVLLPLVLCTMCIKLCTSQSEFNNQKWNLAINGIRLTENISLITSEGRFSNFESTLIEVPILLKVDINEKFSALIGAKFDFYMNQYGFSNNVGANVSFGLQYKPSSNSYIQGLFNYRVNNVSNEFHYNYGSKPSFMLKTGIKF